MRLNLNQHMQNLFTKYVIILDVCKKTSKILSMNIAEKNYSLLTAN